MFSLFLLKKAVSALQRRPFSVGRNSWTANNKKILAFFAIFCPGSSYRECKVPQKPANPVRRASGFLPQSPPAAPFTEEIYMAQCKDIPLEARAEMVSREALVQAALKEITQNYREASLSNVA